MTINTYGTLKAAVANYLNRSDLTSYIPDFITLGAQRMFYGAGAPYDTQAIRVAAMQAQDTGSVSGGYVAFPTRFLEPIRFAASDGTNTWKLDYQPLSSFDPAAPTAASWYTYRDNAIYTGVSAATSYVLDYYAAFSALSADADTNWLLTNAPNAYLYSALIESAPFLGDDARLPQWLALYRSVIAGLNRSDSKHGSGLYVRAR